MDTADSHSDLFDVLRKMGLRVWLSLAAILALGVAAVVVSETSARVTLEATADLGRIHEVRDLASEYLTLLLDAESSTVAKAAVTLSPCPFWGRTACP